LLSPEVIGQLLASAQPETATRERTRLALLGDGSIGRALQLAEEAGVDVADMVQEVLDALPDVKVARAHGVADRLGRSETGFATFMELMRAAIASALGNSVRGVAEPGQARLAGLRPLAEWCDVWHALGTLQDETERFYLDKRQALVSGIALLSRS
jgi:DNA polymerase-3 subunit delta'